MGGYDGKDRRQMITILLGASLHELGHAFGRPHEGESLSIMWRGYDHNNNLGLTRAFLVSSEPLARWDPISAQALIHSPWFVPQFIRIKTAEGLFLTDGGDFALLEKTESAFAQWLALPIGINQEWIQLVNAETGHMLHVQEYKNGFVQTDRAVPAGYWSAMWKWEGDRLVNRWRTNMILASDVNSKGAWLKILSTGPGIQWAR
jgi:hypothetical protein